MNQEQNPSRSFAAQLAELEQRFVKNQADWAELTEILEAAGSTSLDVGGELVAELEAMAEPAPRAAVAAPAFPMAGLRA